MKAGFLGWDGPRRGGRAALVALALLTTATPAHAASISVDNASVAEGSGGQANLTFTISRGTSLSQGSVKVSTQTIPGEATAFSDFTPITNQTVNLPSGLLGSSTQISVAIATDALDEPDEKLQIVLSDPGSDSISDGLGEGTIVDDDPTPTVTIGAGSATEGTKGTRSIGLPVALSAPSGRTVTVDYTVAAGSALVPGDINGAGGTLTIPAGSSGGTVRVSTVTDSLDEPNETFTVTIANPVNATLVPQAATATGTVVNDDTPQVSVEGHAGAEGSGGAPVPYPFKVTLSNPSTRTITVRFRTENVQAVQPADYVAKTTTVTFAPGDVEEIVTVGVEPDSVTEGPEAFKVVLFDPVGATLGTAFAYGGINDDDSPVASDAPPISTPTVVNPGSGSVPLDPTPDRSGPVVRITGLKTRGPRSLRVTVTCPATASRCSGTLTVFSIAQRTAKLRLLRRETRMARGTFALASGQRVTLTLKMTASGQRLLRAAKQVRVRAYGVARNATGSVGTGTKKATLRR